MIEKSEAIADGVEYLVITYPGDWPETRRAEYAAEFASWDHHMLVADAILNAGKKKPPGACPTIADIGQAYRELRVGMLAKEKADTATFGDVARAAGSRDLSNYSRDIMAAASAFLATKDRDAYTARLRELADAYPERALEVMETVHFHEHIARELAAANRTAGAEGTLPVGARPSRPEGAPTVRDPEPGSGAGWDTV